jgi:hypothetical protein
MAIDNEYCFIFDLHQLINTKGTTENITSFYSISGLLIASEKFS